MTTSNSEVYRVGLSCADSAPQAIVQDLLSRSTTKVGLLQNAGRCGAGAEQPVLETDGSAFRLSSQDSSALAVRGVASAIDNGGRERALTPNRRSPRSP